MPARHSAFEAHHHRPDKSAVPAGPAHKVLAINALCQDASRSVHDLAPDVFHKSNHTGRSNAGTNRGTGINIRLTPTRRPRGDSSINAVLLARRWMRPPGTASLRFHKTVTRLRTPLHCMTTQIHVLIQEPHPMLSPHAPLRAFISPDRKQPDRPPAAVMAGLVLASIALVSLGVALLLVMAPLIQIALRRHQQAQRTNSAAQTPAGTGSIRPRHLATQPRPAQSNSTSTKCDGIH